MEAEKRGPLGKGKKKTSTLKPIDFGVPCENSLGGAGFLFFFAGGYFLVGIWHRMDFNQVYGIPSKQKILSTWKKNIEKKVELHTEWVFHTSNMN